MSTLLRWLGDEVERRAIDAAKNGVDATMAACVNHAKSSHPWQNVTGTAEGSIRLEPAVERGATVVGYWGSFDVNYFVFLELGTRRMPAFPSLRPAADDEYPSLAGRIKAAF